MAAMGHVADDGRILARELVEIFAELRALLGRSLAVRVFSMHSFDADPVQRRGLMQSAIEAMASKAVRAPRPTVLPLAEARQAPLRLHAVARDEAEARRAAAETR